MRPDGSASADEKQEKEEEEGGLGVAPYVLTDRLIPHSMARLAHLAHLHPFEVVRGWPVDLAGMAHKCTVRYGTVQYSTVPPELWYSHLIYQHLTLAHACHTIPCHAGQRQRLLLRRQVRKVSQSVRTLLCSVVA